MSIKSNTTSAAVRLSIVVNNHNYAPYLGAALDSAIGQMHTADELIIVDDGSTDESATLLANYAQAHTITVVTQKNQGQMHAVRNGISHARGDIIVLLDSDDLFLDGYLERLRTLYSKHPDVSFVFCNAEIGGTYEAGKIQMRAMLDRMEFPPGKIGTTRWSTQLFQEFVGMPTSGISMHRTLAEDILKLPQQVEASIPMPPFLSRILKVSNLQGMQFGLSADGVIVRYASLLNAQKYYDERPGFMYRIHGENKYASTSEVGRWYLRKLRKSTFQELPGELFDSRLRPSASELCAEITGRAFGKKLRRRFSIRSKYCLAIFSCHGTFTEKCRAWRAALGIAPSGSP